MSLELIIPIAAAFILILVFIWLVNLLKSTVKTILLIGAIFILLQILFGVNSEVIVQAIIKIFEQLQELVLGS